MYHCWEDLNHTLNHTFSWCYLAKSFFLSSPVFDLKLPFSPVRSPLFYLASSFVDSQTKECVKNRFSFSFGVYRLVFNTLHRSYITAPLSSIIGMFSGSERLGFVGNSQSGATPQPYPWSGLQQSAGRRLLSTATRVTCIGRCLGRKRLSVLPHPLWFTSSPTTCDRIVWAPPESIVKGNVRRH